MLVLGLAGPAGAADPTARVSILGQVGGSLLALNDINDGITRGNQFLTSQDWTTLSQIRYGFNFSWDIRARIKGPFTLSLGGGKIISSSSVDFDQVISVKPTTNYYDLLGMYQLPFRPTSNIILSVGAGPVFFSGAQVTVSHEHRTTDTGILRVESATFKGKSAVGLHALLQAEMVLNKKITFVTDLGYRYASIPAGNWSNADWSISQIKDPTPADQLPVQSDGSIGDGILDINELNPDSFLSHSYLSQIIGPNPHQAETDGNGRALYNPTKPLTIDFSGVVLKAGLRFYLF